MFYHKFKSIWSDVFICMLGKKETMPNFNLNEPQKCQLA